MGKVQGKDMGWRRPCREITGVLEGCLLTGWCSNYCHVGDLHEEAMRRE